MQYDLKNELTVSQSLAPETRTSTANGTGVDLQGYHSALVLINCGTWTDGVFTFEVQESDDDSTYAAVASAELDGTEPVVDAADEDEVIHTIGYQGDARYIRVIVTVTGSPSTGMDFGASIIAGHYHRPPVS